MKKKQKKELLGVMKNYLERNNETDRFDDETEGEYESNAVSHGNTRIPYGLCKEFGIQVGKNWTPKQAWNALKNGSMTDSDEVWETLQENGNLDKFKKEFKGSGPRDITEASLGSLMPKGKNGNDIAETNNIRHLIGKIQSKYSVRGDTWATELFTRIGKLKEEKGDNDTYIKSGTIQEFGRDSYYYNPKKHKVKIPPFEKGRDNDYYVAGAIQAMSSYLDYLCGDDEKPMTASDKEYNDVLESFSSGELETGDMDYMLHALGNLFEYSERPRLKKKAAEQITTIKDELSDMWQDMISGKITPYTYYREEVRMISEDDRFKDAKEFERRLDRAETVRELVGDIVSDLEQSYSHVKDEDKKAKLKEQKANRIFANYMALAQVEPRSVSYLRHDLPELTDALDNLVYNMCDKARIPYQLPNDDSSKFVAPDEDSGGKSA